MMRATSQRKSVLEALRNGDALAAQELHARLRADGSRTGLATVYRTLHLLAEEGAVDVIREDPSEARYRLCSPAHHHHLLCDSCGKVIEIPECDVQEWADKVARTQGFVVRTHRAEILGLCASCARRKQRKAPAVTVRKV
jgi:Fur family transcriptional regulator, ferric uptake regulator